jgi:hypothetical protein
MKTNATKTVKTTEQIKADAETNARIERDEDIRLTPTRACEVAEWVITQTSGTFSADAEDDRQKQALLILLSAIVYEEDMTKRENILIDVTKKVFGYSFACDDAENQFIQNGFEHWRSGKWNVQTNESE